MKIFQILIAFTLVMTSLISTYGVQTASAYSDPDIHSKYVYVQGYSMNMKQPRVGFVGKRSTFKAQVEFKGKFEKIVWKWDICGKKKEFIGGKTARVGYTPRQKGNCEIKVSVFAINQDYIVPAALETTLPVRGR